MSDLFFETMDRLQSDLLAGDVAACEAAVAEVLDGLPSSPFHQVVSLRISNSPSDFAAHCDRFFDRESERFSIASAYTEMNGFDINPDRWYCDLFAFDSYGGHADYDWLSDWTSEPFDGYTLFGLEELQAAYASSAFRDSQNRDASNMASLMVVLKFQTFVAHSVGLMKNQRFPLLVTAHDFDFISECRPAGHPKP